MSDGPSSDIAFPAIQKLDRPDAGSDKPFLPKLAEDAGDDLPDQPPTTGVPATASTASGRVSWPVTGEVQAMYGGASYGFPVRDSAESSGGTATSIYSSITGTNPPQLVLTWG